VIVKLSYTVKGVSYEELGRRDDHSLLASCVIPQGSHLMMSSSPGTSSREPHEGQNSKDPILSGRAFLDAIVCIVVVEKEAKKSQDQKSRKSLYPRIDAGRCEASAMSHSFSIDHHFFARV
jgi:hypothetical protein